MADNVVVYWVAKAGVIYAADLVTRTYVGISSMERLGAAKRALDFAGIPHKDWPHGEPATMEEFGVEIRNANALDGWITSINTHATNAEVHGGEARRMLGVLLGWNAPNEGSPEVAGFPRLVQNPPWNIVKQQSNGWWYAYGPGVFFHIQNMDHYGALRTAVLVPDDKWAVVADDNLTQFIHDEMAKCGNQRIEPLGPPGTPEKPTTVTVAAGDTIDGFIKKYGGTRESWVATNKLSSADSIQIGQVLTVPK
jgi:hypothetical protein